MRENAEKLAVPVRTIAIGIPLTFVVATPPTFASAGKSDTLMLVDATVPGDVRKSPVEPQAASASAANAAAALATNSRRAIPTGAPSIAAHGHVCPHVASTVITSLFLISRL
jgi:hypothetical protein